LGGRNAQKQRHDARTASLKQGKKTPGKREEKKHSTQIRHSKLWKRALKERKGAQGIVDPSRLRGTRNLGRVAQENCAWGLKTKNDATKIPARWDLGERLREKKKGIRGLFKIPSVE